MATLAIGHPTAPLINVTLIAEGNFSSEYLSRSETEEYRVKIRHSKEKATKDGPGLDRHNVEMTVRTFPTAEKPQGSTEQAYMVIRSDPNSNGESAVLLAQRLAHMCVARAGQLVAWESAIVG